MDYGRTAQNGLNPGMNGNFGQMPKNTAEQDLEQGSEQIDGQGQELLNYRPERDMEGIGNRVMTSGEAFAEIVPGVNYGEIVEMAAPVTPTGKEERLNFNPADIKVHGDDIDRGTLGVVQEVIGDDLRSGDLNQLYRDVAAMRKRYIKAGVK